MTSKDTKLIVIFTIISLASLLLILWLVDFSNLGIPKFIPELRIRPYGVLILISFILVFIFLQKRLLKNDPATSVWKLILVSSFVAFISLFTYQDIRQLFILRGQYEYDLKTVLLSSAIPTVFTAIIGAEVAIQLKKIKGIWKHAPIVIFAGLFLLVREYVYKLDW